MWQYCYLLIVSLNSDINNMELCFRNHSQNIYGDRPLKPEICNMISKYLVHSAPEILVAGGINCFWNSSFTARSAEDSAKRKSRTQFLLLLWCNTLNYKWRSPSQENLSETAPLGCYSIKVFSKYPVNLLPVCKAASLKSHFRMGVLM